MLNNSALKLGYGRTSTSLKTEDINYRVERHIVVNRALSKVSDRLKSPIIRIMHFIPTKYIFLGTGRLSCFYGLKLF